MAEISLLKPGAWLVEADAVDFRVRGAVLAGAERVAVWDTLDRPAAMEGVADLAPGRPISVIYSHGDWDHVWGTAGLEGRWEEILSHEACVQRFQGDLPEALKERMRLHPGRYDEVRLVPPTRTVGGGPSAEAGVPATEGDGQDWRGPGATLFLGGITLEIHSLPGHTPDTVVGWVPEWGIFLAADAVELPLPFLNPGSPLRDWVDGLEGWLDRLEGSREAPLVVPSHGPLGGPNLLRANIRYLRDLLAGRVPTVDPDLTPFYRETHRANLAEANG